jgi:ubiquinone/menaquinone biosynthesis C-methylase UbiE
MSIFYNINRILETAYVLEIKNTVLVFLCYNLYKIFPMKSRQFKEKKLREELWEKTGWGRVASWYQNTLSADKSTQKDLILPELLKFLPKERVTGKRILDIGCGTGFFLKEYLSFGAAKSLGVDIDPELITLANENLRQEIKEGKVGFLVSDAANLKMIGDKGFDVVLSVESIPNIKDMKKMAEEVCRVLDTGGRFVMVVNHPAFRIPQSSDWHYDKVSLRQGRVVYKYKSSHTIKIDMNPGTKNKQDKIFTYTFHRPFEEYLNTFTKAGLDFSFMKEICSNKVSQVGGRKKEEDIGRQEIPLFLFIEFIKN